MDHKSEAFQAAVVVGGDAIVELLPRERDHRLGLIGNFAVDQFTQRVARKPSEIFERFRLALLLLAPESFACLGSRRKTLLRSRSPAAASEQTTPRRGPSGTLAVSSSGRPAAALRGSQPRCSARGRPRANAPVHKTG